MNVKQAQAALAVIETEIADNASAQDRQVAAIMREQERMASLKRGAITLNEERYHAQQDVSAAEEAALLQINIERAGQVLNLYHADAVANYPDITAGLEWLRRAVRQGLDTRPGSQQHTLIHQAMLLQPPRDDLNTPADQLGGIVDGKSDWATRRRALLAEHGATQSTLVAA